MNMDLLAHWQLRERPFEPTWNTRFFHASKDHEEALSRLHYLAEERSLNLGLLTGEIGSGKTLTRSVFAGQLDSARYRVVVVENSGFRIGELLGIILRGIGGSEWAGGGTSRFARYEQFQRVLGRLEEEGRHLFIVLDEAQDLVGDTLRELRWLTNFNGSGRERLTIVLVGQPELRGLVARNPAINQRIGLRYHLGGLDPEGVSDYLAHRLRVAGHPDGRVFAPEVVHELATITGGIPREINRLAKLALEQAWLAGDSQVETSSLGAVVRDLTRHQALPVL